MVECQLPKLDVAGSSPVARSICRKPQGDTPPVINIACVAIFNMVAAIRPLLIVVRWSGLSPTFLFSEAVFMYNELKDKIWELARPVAESEDMELIHVECIKMHSRWVFRLFLDKDAGVTLDDCAAVSNQLGDILDVHDLTRGPYTLEVSSPGPDRPISRDVDFIRYKGSCVRIRTSEKIDGMKNFQGILTDYADEDGAKIVRLEVSGTQYAIARQQIIKANLVDDAPVVPQR